MPVSYCLFCVATALLLAVKVVKHANCECKMIQ